jgi:2-methylisocitrate lyase-like PEP mutase family enzyme
MQLFINARTDGYVVKMPDALEESLKRIQAYEAAGASGIFVPFVTAIEDIRKITAATSLPVNVVSIKNLPPFKALTGAGVKRISLGSSLYRAMQRELEKRVDSLLNEQSVDCLF